MESDSHIYGLLGRIHVQMRRTLNRITDVEYMRVNAEYSREIVRIGEATDNAELVDLCGKLRVAMELDGPASDAPKKAAPPGEPEKRSLFSAFGHHPKPDEDEEGDNRYIHSLR